jgi:hypothetical protein
MLKAHPLTDLLPMMADDEFASLRESIRINGQREPITRHRDGRTLDGRNHEKACLELGIPVIDKVFEGTDAEILPFVMDINVVRRHLNESQRAMIAAKLETMRRGQRADLARDANLHVLDRAAAARLMSVSSRSVASAAVVRNKGAPELIRAVEQGVTPVAVAAGIAKLPPERQIARLARDQRKADGTHRPDHSFYRTPPPVTHGLLAAERFQRVIWEFACGDGSISKVLIENGHEVISTDLIDRGYGEGGRDFLQERKRRADAAVTNPPFERADEFAQHLIKLGVRKFALLCRLQWLEG